MIFILSAAVLFAVIKHNAIDGAGITYQQILELLRSNPVVKQKNCFRHVSVVKRFPNPCKAPIPFNLSVRSQVVEKVGENGTIRSRCQGAMQAKIFRNLLLSVLKLGCALTDT